MESTTEAKAPTAEGSKNGATPSEATNRESLYAMDATELRAKAREEIDAVQIGDSPQDEEFNPYESSEEPEVEAQETAAEEPEAEEKPNEEEQEEVDTDKPTAKRIRMKVDHLSAQDRAVTELMGRKGLSLAEAYREITGSPLGTPQQKAPQTETETPEEDPIAAQTAKIEEIEAALEQAGKDFKADEMAKLSRELTKESRKLTKMEIEAATSAREKQNQQQSEYRNAEDASTDRAIELFPDLAKEGTPMYDAVQADVERLKKVNPSFFTDPEWPETLAAKHAARLKVSPVGVKQPEKAPVSPRKPLARTTVPAPESSAPPAVQNKPVSAEEERKALWDVNTTSEQTKEIFERRKATAGVKRFNLR